MFRGQTMAVDYYSLMTKAVAGKDAAARDQIYKDAFGLITRSHLTREAASSHAAALQDAIRRIEDDITAEETNSAAVNEMLSTERNWKPFVVGACALVAAIALSAATYFYLATKGPGVVASSSVTASLPKKAQRGSEDVVMADLKPGVDGGSSGEGLPFALQRQVVFYRTTVVPGSIVVDRENRFLYLIDANNSARRYGIGIAQECLKGGSFFRVMNKLEWPEWRPSGANTKEADALLASAGRPGSLLGARALLLDKPGLLIHGTNSPKTIGHLVASGCIRLVNDDVEDLYRRVSVETRVVFVS
jgi:lipoprotein-anchoring transpeptidase ErfK/SrfK